MTLVWSVAKSLCDLLGCNRRSMSQAIQNFARVSEDKPLDSSVDVVTPENISFKYQTAGPFRRIWAFLLDLILIGLTLFLIGMIAGMISGLIAIAIDPLTAEILGNLFSAWYLVFFFVIKWFYSAGLETIMNGQTFGKRLLKLRVVTKDGQPINIVQAGLRNIILAAGMFPYVQFGLLASWISVEFRAALVLEPGLDLGMIPYPTCFVAFCFMMATKGHQRLGDMVADTIVIYEKGDYHFGLATVDDQRAAGLAEYIPPGFVVSREMASAIAHYIDRRRFYDVARRGEISKHLAEPLLKVFGMREDTSHDLLLCAVYYRTFIKQETGTEKTRSGVATSPTVAAEGGGR